MRLTLHTDFALRTLIHAAVHSDRLCTIAEISDGFGVSQNHLAKVVQQLGRLGYVDVRRGRGGGLKLARTAAEINIGEVVREFESDMNIVECFDSASNTCVISPACSLGGVLKDATRAFLSVLDGTTLEDIVGGRRRGRLRQLLGPAND